MYPNDSDSTLRLRSIQEREGRKMAAGQKGGKRAFVPKGHDAVLNRLQHTPGAQIELFLVSGKKLIGQVVARDRFTITVKKDDGRELTVYKHAIECFGKGV